MRASGRYLSKGYKVGTSKRPRGVAKKGSKLHRQKLSNALKLYHAKKNGTHVPFPKPKRLKGI